MGFSLVTKASLNPLKELALVLGKLMEVVSPAT